jgi:iron complex outermembrane recepter protein
MQAQVYYDRVERFVPLQFSEKRDTFDFDSQVTTAIGTQQQLTFGVAARSSRDQTGTAGTIQFSPVNRTMSVASGLVQDEIALFDQRLGVTLGAKFENNNASGFEFQPSIRTTWHLSGTDIIWGAISRAVRSPTRFDDDLRFRAVPSLVVISGNPNFRSEKLVAYEAGYRLQPHAGWSVDLSVFYNRYDDLRSQELSTQPGTLFVLANKLNGETSGGELSVTWQCAQPWRLRTTYTSLQKRLYFDPGSTDPTGGSQEGNDPRHLLTLTSMLDLPHGWEFDAMARYVSALPNPAVPGYTELDLHLGWQPTPNWELAAVAQNLLHAHHREFGAGTPTAHELERGGYAKVTWRY